mgnify:CR=1 FL=1
MISIVSNNMIRFNIKSIANYLLFPKNEVHYIGGAEILPAPLSSEEETLLLTHLDDDVLEARQTLIEHNLRLVVYIAKKFDNTGVGVEDLISIGTIGLIKAISTFNSERSARLSTYAARCIDNELLMMLRSRKKLSREVSLYEPIGQDKEGNAIHLLDVIEEKQKDVVEDLELDRNIRRLFLALDHCLTEREYRIVVMRYGILGCKEHTQQEVGDVLGISRSYVSRMEKRALHKLAEALRED